MLSGQRCRMYSKCEAIISFIQSGYFKIDLVTKKSKWQNYPSDSLDEYGIQLESLEMIEVENAINIRTIWQHFLSFIRFGVVNKGDHWALKALPVIKKLIKQNSYDYILTRAQPSHLIGDYVKRKYDVKWVCTWNDPYPTEMYPKPCGKGNDEKIVGKYAKTISIMKNADVFYLPKSTSCRLYEYVFKSSGG